jgi:hypothetical protein
MIEISILIILILISLLLGILLIRANVFAKAFSLSFFIYNFIWCYFPIISTILLGKSIIFFFPYESFIKFSFLELVPVIIIQFFFLSRKKNFFVIDEAKTQLIEFKPFMEGVILFISFALIIYYWSIIGSQKSITYLTMNSVGSTRTSLFSDNVSGGFTIIRSLVFGYLYAILLSTEGKTLKVYKILALIIILYSSYQDFMLGSRVQLLVPLIILIYYAIIHKWSFKSKFLIVPLVVLFFFVGGALAVISANQRQFSNLSPQVIAEQYSNLYNSSSQSSIIASIFEQLLIKYDSISNGGVLVTYLGAGYAGFNPYIGSILSLVPRIIAPNKPVPGSIDGTYLGTPQRIVPNIFSLSASDVQNTGVSPVSVSVWQTGYLPGIFLFLVFNLLALMFLSSLLQFKSKIILGIAFSILNLPSAAYFLASPDYIILSYQRLIFLYLLVLVISKLFVTKPPQFNKRDYRLQRKRNVSMLEEH